jgi:hypothetical protein
LPASIANYLSHPHHPYFLNQRNHTDASGRPSGHSSSSSHTAGATLNATPAQVQLNHQTSAARGFIHLFQSALPFSLTLAAKPRFHGAHVIPARACARYGKTYGIPGSVFFFLEKLGRCYLFCFFGVWSLRPCAQTAASPPSPALPPRPRPPAPRATAPHPPPAPPWPAPAAQIAVSPA